MTIESLLSSRTFENGVPHHLFDALRADDPVHGEPNPVGGTVWSLTRHADILAVEQNFTVFCSGEGCAWPNTRSRIERMRDNMLFNDPPTHTRLRSFAAKAFSPRVVARFEGWVRELCVEIADAVEAIDGPFDAVQTIAAQLPAQVIASILGVPAQDRARMVRMNQRAFGEHDPEIGPAAAAASYMEATQYALQLRDYKLQNPGVDMTTQLATTDESTGRTPLTDSEYGHMVGLLMSAGFETTHTLIAQMLLLMAENPEIATALDTVDRAVLSRGVDELLRYVTPAMNFGRTVTQDFEFGGRQMVKGDFVLLWFVGGNRDPAVFSDPHRFDITRPRKPHLSFGLGGPHYCIGNALAKLEVELLLQEFSKRRIKLKLAGKPERLPGNMINALRVLPMQAAA